MYRHKGLAWAILLVSVGGCATGPPGNDPAKTTTLSSALFQRVADATKPMRQSWKRVTEAKNPIVRREWDWASGIPSGAPRAELLRPTLSGDVLAQLVPEFRTQAVVLASTHPRKPVFQIENIGGRKVRDCADLHLAAEKSISSGEDVQVDVIGVDSPPSSPGHAMEVDPRTLVAIVHAVAEEHPVMRIVEDGNSWFVIRQGGVRCKFMARVERERGLLQVVMSLVNCWGDQVLLPLEVRAYCNGEPLQCLSVPETLELLYGDPDHEALELEEGAYSFAAVSERDDYLTPTNYKRLCQETEKGTRRSAAPPPQPALASLPGTCYPGPALLGDARALAGFLLQRQLHRPRDPELTGWIMFGSEELRKGGIVNIAVDLGRGLQTYQFNVPAG